MSNGKQYSVGMRVERLIYVTVSAQNEDEARYKAGIFDIEGDEREGDTFNVKIVSVVRDED